MAMPAQQRALRRVLRDNPCTLQALSKAAGVPHSNLYEARDGKRPVSRGMAEKLILALRGWADTCNRLASELEDAIE